jgi:tRNA-specific 2-thiouridylase
MVSPAVVSTDGADVLAELRTPQRGVAAGQALVMYDGDAVLGSATITSAE